MVQIFIDYANNKIIGYNTVVQADSLGDAVLVDDSSLNALSSGSLFGSLYYIDGEVKELEPDGYCNDLKTVNESLTSAKEDVEDEHRIFMDNILSGMRLEDAASFSAKARELVDELEGKRKGMVAAHQEEIYGAIEGIFQKEEDRAEPEHFLSMMAVVRDENEYIGEWIRYHIEEVGFEHFYIYDNESQVPVLEYLESANFKYLDRLTVIPWETSRASQEDANNDFLERYSRQTKWFLAADPDEYVVLKDGSKTLIEFLQENGQYATIKCLWKHYNANGQVAKTGGTDMERFTEETDWEGWKHGGKKFAQSNRVARFRSYVPVERMGARTLDWWDEAATGFFCLNHYFTRSWEEWKQKIKRGSGNPWYRRKLSMFFELNPDLSYLDTGEDLEQGYGAAKKIGGNSPQAEYDVIPG